MIFVGRFGEGRLLLYVGAPREKGEWDEKRERGLFLKGS